MPNLTLTPGQWWIPAIVAGLALSLALQFIASTPWQRVFIGATPLLAAVFIALDGMARGHTGETALKLFTAAALGAAVTRVVFTPYIRRQVARRRSGLPFQQLSAPKTAFFLVVLMTSMIGVGATLSVLE